MARGSAACGWRLAGGGCGGGSLERCPGTGLHGTRLPVLQTGSAGSLPAHQQQLARTLHVPTPPCHPSPAAAAARPAALIVAATLIAGGGRPAAGRMMTDTTTAPGACRAAAFRWLLLLPLPTAVPLPPGAGVPEPLPSCMCLRSACLQGPADVCGFRAGPAAARRPRAGGRMQGWGVGRTHPLLGTAACACHGGGGFRDAAAVLPHAAPPCAHSAAAPLLRLCLLAAARRARSIGATWRAGGATPSRPSLRSARGTPGGWVESGV